tara:strand:- start:1676 stop:2245 length:570 start_codon:yes stop_codon:yes gene_type:complete
MKDIQEYIQVHDRGVDPALVSYIVRYFNTQKDFHDGGVFTESGPKTDKTLRDVKNLGLHKLRKELTSVYINNVLSDIIFKQVTTYQKTHPYARVQNLDLQVLKYSTGGHYTWHTDSTTSMNRLLSVIITLNNDYEGGELLISPTGSDKNCIKIKPGVGRIIMWPSTFLYPHKVNPVTKGTRYSIVGWLW